MPELSRSEVLAYVAANVRRLRTGRLTQQQLEAATGLDVQYIRKIEGGRVNITVDTLRRLANALGVAPGVLLRKARLSPAKPGRPRKRSVRQAR
jgi:transcriptional regulator with XRE-family HTH domain